MQVYLDIGLCPEALRNDRRIGDRSALCPSATPLGRITLGLYGGAAPATAANFTSLIADGVYAGTTFHKVQAGKFVKAGKQGSRRFGLVDPTLVKLPRNPDVVCACGRTFCSNLGGVLVFFLHVCLHASVGGFAAAWRLSRFWHLMDALTKQCKRPQDTTIDVHDGASLHMSFLPSRCQAESAISPAMCLISCV
jgi:hypothetical protein